MGAADLGLGGTEDAFVARSLCVVPKERYFGLACVEIMATVSRFCPLVFDEESGAVMIKEGVGEGDTVAMVVDMMGARKRQGRVGRRDFVLSVFDKRQRDKIQRLPHLSIPYNRLFMYFFISILPQTIVADS